MKKLILSALIMVLVSSFAMAQDSNRQRGQRNGQRQRIDPTEMITRQADRLVKQMKLEKDKEDLFKTLYLAYQTERRNAVDPKNENKDQEEIDYKKLTDEQATKLINERLDGQEKQAKLDKEYLEQFLQFLTPVQAAQVFVPQVQAANREQTEGQRMGGPRGGFGGGFGGFGGFGGGFPGGGF